MDDETTTINSTQKKQWQEEGEQDLEAMCTEMAELLRSFSNGSLVDVIEDVAGEEAAAAEEAAAKNGTSRPSSTAQLDYVARIETLRSQCIAVFGEEKFKAVYAICQAQVAESDLELETTNNNDEDVGDHGALKSLNLADKELYGLTFVYQLLVCEERAGVAIGAPVA